jgi:hypothetical protein
MTKKELLEKLVNVADDEEIYVIKDNADNFDRSEFLHATMAHWVNVANDGGGTLVEADSQDEGVTSVFVVYSYL